MQSLRLSGPPWRRTFRGAIGGRRKPSVALSAVATTCRDKSLIGFRQIREQFAGLSVGDQGPDRDFDDGIVAAFARFIVRSAIGTTFPAKMANVSKVVEGVAIVGRDENDVAAFSAVATRPTATRNEFLATEGYRPVSTVACGDIYLCFIYKHDRYKQKNAPVGRCEAT